jgi:hypothetical protein
MAICEWGKVFSHLYLLDQKNAAIEEYEAVKSLKGEEMIRSLFDIIQMNTGKGQQ